MKKHSTGSWKVQVFTFMACLGLILSTTPVRADDIDRPQFDLSVDILSQYIFRGIAFSKDSAVIQPSMTASYKGFSVNMWGNLDTREAEGFGDNGGGASWNETDFTVAYSRELFTGLQGTVGTVYYAIVGDDSVEVYGGLSYDLPWLTVGFTAYREVSHFPGWWLQVDLTRTFELPWYGMSVDLGATFGYQTLEDEDTLLDKKGNEGDYSAFHSAQFSAALNIPLGKHITLSPKIGFTTPLSDKAADRIEAASWDGEENHIFGGIQIAASF